MLYNNGYIVKDLIINENLSLDDKIYRGIESFHNWPLDRQTDKTSRELTHLANNHFDEHNYMEIMLDGKLLKKYVDHCRALGIDVIILKIMSYNDTFTADEDFDEEEILGYDCMAGDSVSYLTELYLEGGKEIASFQKFRSIVNNNGLLNNYEEVLDFIKERELLIEQGLDLEDYWLPVPVRLSLVKF